MTSVCAVGRLARPPGGSHCLTFPLPMADVRNYPCRICWF
jgi:hypothetical protein